MFLQQNIRVVFPQVCDMSSLKFLATLAVKSLGSISLSEP